MTVARGVNNYINYILKAKRLSRIKSDQIFLRGIYILIGFDQNAIVQRYVISIKAL